MKKTATLLLKHRPTDERCSEIAAELATQVAPGEEAKASWFVTEEIPEGYAVHLADQLAAYRRDLPGDPVYLTVTVTTD
jgi:hypothetical protein